MIKTTCGIFLINKYKQILIGHPTGIPVRMWSIPKGIKESCESELRAAWREVTEETGILRDDIIRGGFKYRRSLLGCSKYSDIPKQLVAFAYEFDGIIKKTPVCDSTFYCMITEQRRPEIDRWRWVHYKTAFKYLNETQQVLLLEGVNLGLFDGKKIF
jgi:8-oxo-dGTP pyrophosphatase MutT (NUDIX family)